MSFASCCERCEPKHSVWAGCGFLQVGLLSVGGFILRQAESGPSRMKGFFVLALSLTLLIFFGALIPETYVYADKINWNKAILYF